MDLTNRPRQSAARPASRAGISLSRHSRGALSGAGQPLVAIWSRTWLGCWIPWKGARCRPGADAIPLVPERARQCPAVIHSRDKPWRKMPKRVRPYGSAEDAELAGLSRGRPRRGLAGPVR